MADDKKIIFSMVNVSKLTPQGKQIIKDIHLSFYYGAKIGILGLNGCGKSSLMKILAGVEEEFDGIVSRCYQHELDHMQGTVFTELVSKLKLNMALKKRDKEIKRVTKLWKQKS